MIYSLIFLLSYLLYPLLFILSLTSLPYIMYCIQMKDPYLLTTQCETPSGCNLDEQLYKYIFSSLFHQIRLWRPILGH